MEKHEHNIGLSEGNIVCECGLNASYEKAVRAVNCYEELLAAAKDALCWLDPDCKLYGVKLTDDSSQKEIMISALYKAIAEAKGKE